MTEPRDSPSALVARFGAFVFAAQIGAIAIAVIDVALVSAFTGPPASTAARAIIAAVGLSAACGALLGGLAGLLWWAAVGDRDPKSPGRRALWAIAVAALTMAVTVGGAVVYVSLRFARESLMVAASALATMVAVIVAVAAYRVAWRLLPANAVVRGRAAVAVGAVALYGWLSGLSALDRVLDARVSAWLRGLLLLPVGGWIAARAYRAARRWWRGHRPARAFALWAAATLALAVVALGPATDDSGLRTSMWPRLAYLPLIESSAPLVFDRDGDGYSALLGGGDCDDGSASRSPIGVEVPANGADDDCAFGDQSAPVDEPAPATAPSIANTVVLVTVAGLFYGDAGLSPALPKTARHIETGVRFSRPAGAAGRWRHAAPIFVTGQLPRVTHASASAFPLGGPTLPWLVEQRGAAAMLSHPVHKDFAKITSLFRRQFLSAKGKTPRIITDRAVAMRARAGKKAALVWAHYAVDKKSARAVDDAIDSLVSRLQERDGATVHVVVVAMTPDRAARANAAAGAAAPGGPVGMFGHGIATATVDAPVSSFDVFPTLLASLGVKYDADGFDSRAPLGRSLHAVAKGEATRPALTAWLGVLPVVGALGAQQSTSFDYRRMRFARTGGAGGDSFRHDEHPADGDDPVTLFLRDRVLSPHRADRNRAITAALTNELPDDVRLTPGLEIANALTVLGFKTRDFPGGQLELTVYLRGGERLWPGDRLGYRIGWMEGSTIPGGGGYPFGRWRPGQIYAHRQFIDTRFLASKTPVFRIGVLRRGALLDVTAGPGPKWLDVGLLKVPK